MIPSRFANSAVVIEGSAAIRGKIFSLAFSLVFSLVSLELGPQLAPLLGPQLSPRSGHDSDRLYAADENAELMTSLSYLYFDLDIDNIR